MEPVYYVIAILGCSDGSTECKPVATLPTHYASQEACSAQTSQALVTHNRFDFPSLVAECRATDPRTIAEQERPETLPAGALRG